MNKMKTRLEVTEEQGIRAVKILYQIHKSVGDDGAVFAVLEPDLVCSIHDLIYEMKTPQN